MATAPSNFSLSETGRLHSSLSTETSKLEPFRPTDADHLANMPVPTFPGQANSSDPCKENTPPNIPHGVIRYWILSSIAFCVIAPLMSILLGFFLHTQGLNYIPPDNQPVGRTLSMNAFLVSADPTSSVITFDWSIDNDTCWYDPNVDPCTDVKIFFDNNLLNSQNSDNGIPSSDIPSTALFRFNSTATGSGDVRANSPTFRTDIRLFENGTRRRLSLINYPFDTYAAEIFMFAQDSDNITVNLFLDSAQGNAVGFTAALSPNPNNTLAGTILVDINVERGGLIIAFCVIITIAIWLITLALFLLSFTSVIFGFRQRTEVLIVPVATVFAFTQLRGSMPGAPPGFGDVLDFIGLLPCLGILSFSCALTLGALLITDPTKKTELTWEMIKPEILPALGFKKKTGFYSTGGHSSGVQFDATA